MKTLIFASVFLITSFTSAQNDSSDNRHSHHHKSTYVSDKENEIKSLSSAEIEQLLNGAGMGLAKAAELNSYPGPKHVLELSSELNLTAEQSAKTESFFNEVKIEAVKLGKAVVEKERELEMMFEQVIVNEKTLLEKVLEIAKLKGELRFVHLNAHLKQKEILTEEQIASYNKLRGYSGIK